MPQCSRKLQLHCWVRINKKKRGGHTKYLINQNSIWKSIATVKTVQILYMTAFHVAIPWNILIVWSRNFYSISRSVMFCCLFILFPVEEGSRVLVVIKGVLSWHCKHWSLSWLFPYLSSVLKEKCKTRC